MYERWGKTWDLLKERPSLYLPNAVIQIGMFVVMMAFSMMLLVPLFMVGAEVEGLMDTPLSIGVVITALILFLVMLTLQMRVMIGTTLLVKRSYEGEEGIKWTQWWKTSGPLFWKTLGVSTFPGLYILIVSALGVLVVWATWEPVVVIVSMLVLLLVSWHGSVLLYLSTAVVAHHPEESVKMLIKRVWMLPLGFQFGRIGGLMLLFIAGSFVLGFVTAWIPPLSSLVMFLTGIFCPPLLVGYTYLAYHQHMEKNQSSE